MNFKDLFMRYQQGTATNEEIALVEEELAKNQAINDYLAEQDFSVTSLPSPDENDGHIRGINRRVWKKLSKVVAISVAMVFLLMLGSDYVLSPLVSSFYYDPTQCTMGQENTTDTYYDLAVLYELNYPNIRFANMISQPLGYGRYQLYYRTTNNFTNLSSNQYQGTLTRNQGFKYTMGNMDTYDHHHFGNLLTNKDDFWLTHSSQKSLENLQQLNPVSYVSAYIAFPKPLSLETYSSLAQRYEAQGSYFRFQWLMIETGDNRSINQRQYLGFSPHIQSTVWPSLEAYPYLNWHEALANDNVSYESIDAFNQAQSQAMANHFTDLLRYILDRQEVIAPICYPNDFPMYQSALDYVQDNGVNCYGALVYAQADELNAFIEAEGITYIQINDVLPSVFASNKH